MFLRGSGKEVLYSARRCHSIQCKEVLQGIQCKEILYSTWSAMLCSAKIPPFPYPYPMGGGISSPHSTAAKLRIGALSLRVPPQFLSRVAAPGCNMVYLQFGGGEYSRQNNVTVTPSIATRRSCIKRPMLKFLRPNIVAVDHYFRDRIKACCCMHFQSGFPGQESIAGWRISRTGCRLGRRHCLHYATSNGNAFAFHNAVAASWPWNSLPDDITSALSLSVFRHKLKSYLFQKSYPDTIM